MTDSRNEFIIESREHLQVFERSLLALEKATTPAETRGLIEQSLRAVHSLKGDAGFLGFTNIRDLSHAMESLIEVYRSGSGIPSCNVIEALLAARDSLSTLVEDLEHSNQADIGAVLKKLKAATSDQPTFNVSLDLANCPTIDPNSLVSFFTSLSTWGFAKGPRVESPHLGKPLENLTSLPFRFQLASLPCKNSAEFIDWISKTPGVEIRDASNQRFHVTTIDLTSLDRNGDSLVQWFQRVDESGDHYPLHLEYPKADFSNQLPSSPVCWIGLAKEGATRKVTTETLQVVDPVQTSVPNSTVMQPTMSQPAVVATQVDTQPVQHPAHRPVDEKQLSNSTPAAASPVLSTASNTSTGDTERLRSLRINVELLDRLMNLVGELTLVRNQSQVAFRDFEGEARNIIQRLNNVTTELQDTVLQTRMQPVGNLFGRFPRMVRDLARQLGKEVEIETVGQEVELDKTVLERLSDPLTHLIRNSIDHGLESPSERLAAGKTSTGKITLSATPADGQVYIEIRDDGRGINPAAIKAKATSIRLRSESELERMSHRELFSLILLPGFSTAKQVTDVSGRGVGMDVVKTNVEELEGSLTIDSWFGKGTSIVLRVPLTLAIVPCLIVTVGKDRFAVPQREVEEVVCLHSQGKGKLEHAFDTEVYRLRENLLPIVRFSEVLARSRPFTSLDKTSILSKYPIDQRDPSLIEYILVVRTNGKRYGLLVDEVKGREEIVVKPLHPAMKQLNVFSGATLMGDGKVALIANAEGIAEHARCFGVNVETTNPNSIRDPHEVHRVLLFEDGTDEQFALPLIQVKRVELLEMSRIEKIGNKEFVTLDGISVRVLRLCDAMNVSKSKEQESMFLILPKFVTEPMGILASRIVDTESLSIELQAANHQPGMLGTAIVRDRLSIFLDIQQLREFLFEHAVKSNAAKPNTIDPQSASRTNMQGEAASSKRNDNIEKANETTDPSSPFSLPVKQRILLVDDTPFFREVVKRYLQTELVEIDTAVDGKNGLELLARNEYDLVVSDIEMPTMDGWQFCKAARDAGYKMPFVALTSLAKLENEKRAVACGFDDFEEKLDHDRLKGKVADWLERSLQRKEAQS